MTTSQKIPLWYWIVSTLALLWNLSGAVIYIMQAYNPEMMMADMTEVERELMANTPAWVTAAFATAVFSGSAACVGLLLRRKWAGPLFWLSWAGAAAQFSYNFLIIDLMTVSGPGTIIMPIVVLAIGLGLIALARMAKSREWAR
ncbi:hypothetical protein KFE98_16530 [bacterium SCSIO 12741]|nr:hypothetical protein KFE98_16530 [bacterium SCSIO 12741]